MKKNQKLEEWINLASTIWKIYQQLIEDRCQNQKEKYQDDLEMLKMCIDLENKIYQSLEVSIDNFRQYYLKFEILINRKNYPQKEKELIFNRINGYLLTPEYLNPFLSMQSNVQKNQLENEIAIEIQYDIEYLKHFFSRIDKYLQTAKTKAEQKKLLRCYYETLFEFKLSEHLLANLKLTKDFTLSEREKCILFHQNPKEVEYFYRAQSNDWINKIISEILNENFSSKTIQALKEKINLEAILSILTKEESSSFLHKIYEEFLKNPSITNNTKLKENLDFLTKTIGNFYQNSINESQNRKELTYQKFY